MSAASVAVETVHPPALSLPQWPQSPPAIDPAGREFLVISVGDDSLARQTARHWAETADDLGPVTWVVLGTITSPDDQAMLARTLGQARTGVRIYVAGGQYDVLQVLAAARAAGAIADELHSFVTHQRDLPLFCVHCRVTSRVTAAPGDTAACPGCDRTLEVHPHLAAARGSFLASDATARELA